VRRATAPPRPALVGRWLSGQLRRRTAPPKKRRHRRFESGSVRRAYLAGRGRGPRRTRASGFSHALKVNPVPHTKAFSQSESRSRAAAPARVSPAGFHQSTVRKLSVSDRLRASTCSGPSTSLVLWTSCRPRTNRTVRRPLRPAIQRSIYSGLAGVKAESPRTPHRFLRESSHDARKLGCMAGICCSPIPRPAGPSGGDGPHGLHIVEGLRDRVM